MAYETNTFYCIVPAAEGQECNHQHSLSVCLQDSAVTTKSNSMKHGKEVEQIEGSIFLKYANLILALVKRNSKKKLLFTKKNWVHYG